MTPEIMILEPCSGCGACVEICPVFCLQLGEHGVEVIREQDCLGCRQCEEVCPEDAIRIAGIVP